jgi:hypothetical protein
LTDTIEPTITSYLAIVDQREFPAEITNDDRVVFTWDMVDLPAGFERRKDDRGDDTPYVVARPDSLDGLYSRERVCRWRDHNFMVARVSGDTAVLFYTDSDFIWARDAGLTQESPGAWTAFVPVADLEELHEERTDKLAIWVSYYRRAHPDEPGADAGTKRSNG